MFRILCLDGGGIKGTFTAAVLKYFEDQLHHPVASYFDLVVGTSTGGILALGLASGLKAADMLQFYREEGPRIFPAARQGIIGSLRKIFAPQYDDEVLRQVVSQRLPGYRFVDLPHRLAIPAFDATAGRPVVFKTRYHPSLTGHVGLTTIDVAMATSAAPTYFPAAQAAGSVLIDGGVWANCPVMVGITEALSLFKCKCDQVRVLSIGTTISPDFVDIHQQDGGLLHWTAPVSGLLMRASRLATLEMARKLATVVRVDEIVNAGRFELDNATVVTDLASLGEGRAHQDWGGVRPLFFSKRAPAYTPAQG